MSDKQVVTRPGGTPKWTLDATANDSDKTFTVPAGKVWSVHSIEVGIVATATVGNRLLGWSISNATPAVVSVGINSAAIVASARGGMFITNGNNVAATPVRRSLQDAGASNNSVFVNDQLPMPCLLPAGYSIRVWDLGAVDAAADDMTVAIHYTEYEA